MVTSISIMPSAAVAAYAPQMPGTAAIHTAAGADAAVVISTGYPQPLTAGQYVPPGIVPPARSAQHSGIKHNAYMPGDISSHNGKTFKYALTGAHGQGWYAI